jgi:hypothetical protein
MKTYVVYLKHNPDIWYEVDAPSKRVARWVGFNIHNSNYMCGSPLKDYAVKRKKYD